MKAKAPPAKKVASLDQSRRGSGSWTGTIEAEHWQAWWGTHGSSGRVTSTSSTPFSQLGALLLLGATKYRTTKRVCSTGAEMRAERAEVELIDRLWTSSLGKSARHVRSKVFYGDSQNLRDLVAEGAREGAWEIAGGRGWPLTCTLHDLSSASTSYLNGHAKLQTTVPARRPLSTLGR